jgi:REP element-mobilizing transposase RayT
VGVSRLRRIEQGERYFFITTNLAEGVAPLTAAERVIVLRILGTCRAKLGFKIFAYVVMADHVHLLIEPESSTLTGVMREFKSKSGLALNEHRRTRGPVWQARFFDFVCRRVRDFWQKTEYIHDNPVKAGLVGRAEDGVWSSAAGPGVLAADPIDLPAEGNTLLWPAPWR